MCVSEGRKGRKERERGFEKKGLHERRPITNVYHRRLGCVGSSSFFFFSSAEHLVDERRDLNAVGTPHLAVGARRGVENEHCGLAGGAEGGVEIGWCLRGGQDVEWHFMFILGGVLLLLLLAFGQVVVESCMFGKRAFEMSELVFLYGYGVGGVGLYLVCISVGLLVVGNWQHLHNGVGW